MVDYSKTSAFDVVLDSRSGFQEYLIQSNYSSRSLPRFVTTINGFQEWLKGKDYSPQFLHEASVVYLNERTDITDNTRNGYRFCLNRLIRYLCDVLGFLQQSEETEFTKLEEEFASWLHAVRAAGVDTVNLRLGYLRRFLSWCSAQGLELMRPLGPRHIEEFFIEAEGLGFGRAFKRSLRTCMRQFLVFCFERGHCEQDLSGAVPCLRSYRQDHVPRAIAEVDAQALLSGIERRTASGIRDYAIIRLLYEYGVRGIQVRSLKLTDINWHTGEIFFTAVKDGKNCHLPLTAEVGNAILAYLRVRPAMEYPEVFLTLHAPCRRLRCSSTISEIIRRRLEQLGINSSVKGAHGFRHALAKRLLQQETPLKCIADLLGHRCIQTTFIYTKVDFAALADVALELPEVEL